ncbi:hypothetical protein ACHAPJ_008727 [Fusarium lateritium]
MRFITIVGLVLGIISPASAHNKKRPLDEDFFIKDSSDNFFPKDIFRAPCRIVDRVITNADQAREASSYCASYLQTPAVTFTTTITISPTYYYHSSKPRFPLTIARINVTSTVTPEMAITTDVTKTVTITADDDYVMDLTPITSTVTKTEYVEAAETTSITNCVHPKADLQKPSLSTYPRPSPFGTDIKDGKAMSRVCRCLDPNLRSTETAEVEIVTEPVTSTEIITMSRFLVQPIREVTETIYQRDTYTINTVFELKTVTETQTIYTSTTTVFAVPEFNIYAVGGHHDGYPMRGRMDSAQQVAMDNRKDEPLLEFSIGSNNTLKVLNGEIAGTIGRSDLGPHAEDHDVKFGKRDNDLPGISCKVTRDSDGTCPMTCQGQQGSLSYDCGVHWRLGEDADVKDCQGSAFTPYAVDVS